MNAHLRCFALTVVAVFSVATHAGAQVTVTTGTPTDHIVPFGKESDLAPIPTAIAQTFVLPSGMSILETFRFFISGGFGGGSTLGLRASVYAFDTDHLSGPALFSSTPFLGTDNPSTDLAIDFGAGTPLDVALSPGVVYALVLSSVEGYASTPDFSTISVGQTDDLYADGSMFVTTVADPSALFDPLGAPFVDSGVDAAFSATFGASVSTPTATPEPSTAALALTGFIAVAGLFVRRRWCAKGSSPPPLRP